MNEKPAQGKKKSLGEKAGWVRKFSTLVEKPLYRHTVWYNMDKYEIQTIHNWHEYIALDGKQEFEEFYGRSLKTQGMLLRMLRWRRRA